jgi:thiamine transport system permease protein
LIPFIHAVVALPFVVRSSLSVAESIPQGLREAAAVLGASPVRRWWAVDAPLLAPALATGCGLSAALSLGEFGATSFLTRQRTQTLPIVVDGRAGDTAFTTAMAAATLLLALTSLIVVSFDSTMRT